MKKVFFLLFGSVFLANSFYTRLSAQCTISNMAIELVSAVPVTGGCQVVFNFSWDQEVNGGNKFAYIHLWNTSQYPRPESKRTCLYQHI